MCAKNEFKNLDSGDVDEFLKLSLEGVSMITCGRKFQ